jgi:hypothetical protein
MLIPCDSECRKIIPDKATGISPSTSYLSSLSLINQNKCTIYGKITFEEYYPIHSSTFCVWIQACGRRTAMCTRIPYPLPHPPPHICFFLFFRETIQIACSSTPVSPTASYLFFHLFRETIQIAPQSTPVSSTTSYLFFTFFAKQFNSTPPSTAVFPIHSIITTNYPSQDEPSCPS